MVDGPKQTSMGLFRRKLLPPTMQISVQRIKLGYCGALGPYISFVFRISATFVGIGWMGLLELHWSSLEPP